MRRGYKNRWEHDRFPIDAKAVSKPNGKQMTVDELAESKQPGQIANKRIAVRLKRAGYIA